MVLTANGYYFSWAGAPVGIGSYSAPLGLEANWYKFDNCNNGSEIDYGSSANNLSGVRIATWSAGKIGSAVYLPGGSDGSVTAQYFASDNLTSWANDISGTFAFWGKLDNYLQDERAFYGVMNGGSILNLAGIAQCYVGKDGKIYNKIFSSNNQKYAVKTTNLFTLGSWHHVVIKHDATTVAIYLDGVSESLSWDNQTDKTKWLKSAITDSNPPANNFTVGLDLRNQRIENPWSGLIDDLRYYHKPLTDAEIVWIYNSGAGRSTALTF